jgi:hypothetical protein
MTKVSSLFLAVSAFQSDDILVHYYTDRIVRHVILGQTGFDADCECFRTTNKVLVFEATDAYLKATTSSGAMMGVRSFVAVAGAAFVLIGM